MTMAALFGNETLLCPKPSHSSNVGSFGLPRNKPIGNGWRSAPNGWKNVIDPALGRRKRMRTIILVIATSRLYILQYV